ncbi:Acyl-CoA synthetase (AMP-forming)/AMP-acid ligase II [Nonomuraea solani]|uniref:Acyl-CoA synthetase (AMP-forming)/AMP-acid ligase II n=1 Tax=Nonomuraea solani TaxID=1144553 RepID=A0A1H6EU37_9ACTN|nr:AMP-binding protein [Nonomuraea solani]SEH00204.1 Acyl-CoA synthetase (AMP-forming)/AMP-acid ligase II [Nonomuraea solani]
MTRFAELVDRALVARAATMPEEVAFRTDDGQTLTYAGWDAASRALAGELAAAAPGTGHAAGLSYTGRDWLGYAVAVAAVYRAGFVCVPIHKDAPADAAASVGCALVITPDTGIQVTGGRAYAARDELADLMFTSGTTGAPRPVPVSARGVIAAELGPDLVERPPPPRRSRYLHALPPGSAWAQTLVRAALRGEVEIVAQRRFDPGAFAALVEFLRPARIGLVPAMARLLVDTTRGRTLGDHGVEHVFCSAAPLAPATFRDLTALFAGATVLNVYTLSEARWANICGVHDPGKPTAVGPVPPGVEVVVLDESGAPAPAHSAGELVLRRLGEEVRTGDVGRVDEDGIVHVLGRADEILNVGGVKVSAREIVQALEEHPSVREAAVVGLDHPVLGTEVAAAVVFARPGDVPALLDDLRRRLPDLQVPRRVLPVAELPRTELGKVRLGEIKDRLTAAAPRTRGPGPLTRDGVVAAVREEVARELGVPAGLDDDLFDLGATSLSAVRIAERLSARLGVDVRPHVLMESVTAGRVVDAILGATV